jgi:integrase
VRRKFSDFMEAKREAAFVASKLSAGESEVLKLSGIDRAVYLQACRTLRPLGIPLTSAVEEYAATHRMLPEGVTLREAVQFYAARSGCIERKRVADVVSEMIAEKSRRSKHGRPASDAYLHDLTVRLGRFASSFSCDLCDLTAKDVRRYLSNLNGSGRNWANVVRLLKTLFRFAASRGYYAAVMNPLEGIEVSLADAGPIEIYRPREMQLLLNAAKAEVTPFIAIGAFAGLRHQELMRLDWEQVWGSPGYIEVKAEDAKMRSRRLVPICANLAKWLSPFSQRTGPVASHRDMWKQLHQAAAAVKRAGGPMITAKKNALRHSFISYRYASLQNENQVAAEAGNSPAIVHRNYRAVVTPEAAKRWFSIAPPECGSLEGKLVLMAASDD